MKKLLTLALAATMFAACGQKKDAPKMLVLYYSQTANTKVVADEIANRLCADIAAIEAVEPYNSDFQTTIERCMKECELEVLPDIQPLTVDLAQYDVIFLGYPVWFGTYAPPVAAFLTQTDLSGKTVVPFCTFGSGGLESSMNDLANVQPNADIRPGYGVRAARLQVVPQEVERFLIAGGFLEGELKPLADFTAQHPVSEEEAAVFDVAVNGYPMLHAKAVTVASRAGYDGTEYLFVAEDLPREGAPEMPTHEVQVYVLVADCQAPVFTKVVR
ncbi:MAG: hypothetical protein K5660_08775 [Paludibacteraceae bacterium]|nr:hypothetical protein [Paludibacteraceae bacterium]